MSGLEETEGPADFPLARRALAVVGRAPEGVPLEKLESWLRDRNVTEANLAPEWSGEPSSPEQPQREAATPQQ